ncbi:hypothetical protein INT45_011594 [Circinella minor]|uniref:Chromo domain-containing protein n=1 Tax=Circinella minor TaxID=1195481 RepID=A0A8H7VCV4_9FUNG|nr:hypothetical protein INT45_011594 [Circinella minor]
MVLYTNKEYPAPYFEIEKGLFLLYHLVSGIAGSDIEKYLPQSTFHTFYKKFWMDNENYKRINKIVNDALTNMFSNIKLRILSARKNNPDLFKHITLILDGHDSRINYTDTDLDRSRLYSYKFKKNGLRTQFAADINDIIIFVSKSEFCSDSSDGSMFLNMKLYNKMNENDTLAVDGGYTLFITQFIELANEKGYEFSNDNFVYPIRKNINENITITKEHFNNTFGSFRTRIENQFSEIGNKFYRFNNNKSIVKMDNIKFYNLQFRVACLLKNINKFVELFNVPILPHHKLWHSNNFEFPIEKKLIDVVVSNNKQNKDKFDRMMQLQNNLLNMAISDNTMAVDDTESNHSQGSESDNDVPNFNERTRKRRRNIKGKQRSTASYEIESIIGHIKENDAYLFQVKWIGYSNEEDNSWLSIDMFNQKKLLKAYIEEHNLGIL